jgi:chemotaxis protein CheZ
MGALSSAPEPGLRDAARQLTEALQQEDASAVSAALATLTQMDEASLRARLARLAEAVHQRLQSLPVGVGNGNGAEACLSLEHVVSLTEDATHRTLDLVDQGRSLVDVFADDHESSAAVDALRQVFNELAVAQGYQDITGQIIRRVLALLRGLETSLGTLASGAAPERDAGHASGPAVPGVDAPRATQHDADDLLASLGL